MRRKKQQLDPEAAEKILADGTEGILSTINFDGTPYGVPVNYAWFDGYIWIHGTDKGQKADNIRQNPNVCFTVIGKKDIRQETYSTDYTSVIVQGKASLIQDLDALRKMTAHLCPNQSSQENEAEIRKAAPYVWMIRIEPESITGKRSRQ